MDIKLNLNIYYKRKANGFTLKDVRKATGISINRLSRMEGSGKIELSDLIKIALFLSVEEKELYTYKIVE